MDVQQGRIIADADGGSHESDGDGGEMSDYYRKKPVTIQAWRWAESKNQRLLLEMLGMKSGSYWGKERTDECTQFHIMTLEGASYEVQRGDWIIKGVNGEFYPCKPDVFEKTYEQVNPPSED